MQKLNQKTIDEVKSKNPGAEIHRLDAGEVSVLVKAPDDAQWSSFSDAKEKSNSRAFKQLVRDCLLWPTDDEYLDLLKTKPALSNLFGIELMGIAGLKEEATSKKV